jgi:hypothetical protein
VSELLLREDGRGVLAIGQASHAWISGQLAEAWGNRRFGVVEPRREVCLAAVQHDVGMAAWDLAPMFNPQTGLPYSFVEMPLAVHIDLWTHGPPRLVSQSRYGALLVSAHGRRLYERRDLERLSPEDAAMVREFLAVRASFEAELTRSLRADPITAASATDAVLARNSQLLWTWDYLSLAVCLDWAPGTASDVPTATGEVELRLAASPSGRLTLDPWPFSVPTLSVRCEGRRLPHRFDSADALAEALLRAPWETLDLELEPLAVG